MAKMLSMDSVKNRLASQQSMTFMEFNYMTMQAVDFVVLNNNLGINVQIGGSDQWGNITMGIDLHKKLKGENHIMSDEEKIFGITTPLLVNKDGTKMGKTENGALWLDPTRVERKKFWDFWRSTPDDLTATHLGMFTECDSDTLNAAKKASGAALNPFKIMIADFVTNLVFGEA